MSLKHTWTLGVKNDSNATVVADQYVFTGTAEENFSEQAAASSTLHIVFPITVANVLSFYIESNVAVTLKINSSTSPAQTISLAAKTAFAWNNGMPNTNPILENITDLYFVNAGTTVATVVGGFLLNQ